MKELNERVTIKENAQLISQIEQWPVRCKRANKKGYQLAKESNLDKTHLSQIFNFKIKSINKSTITRIEKALQDWGV